eukprot:jgi/Botrbrau1/18490/Bobra.0072s0070.2
MDDQAQVTNGSSLDGGVVTAVLATPLFAGISRDRVQAISWQQKTIRASSELFPPGNDNLVGLILDGTCRLMASDTSGRPTEGNLDRRSSRPALLLCAGDTCGEAALSHGRPSYRLVAASPVTLLQASVRPLRQGTVRVEDATCWATHKLAASRPTSVMSFYDDPQLASPSTPCDGTPLLLGAANHKARVNNAKCLVQSIAAHPGDAVENLGQPIVMLIPPKVVDRRDKGPATGDPKAYHHNPLTPRKSQVRQVSISLPTPQGRGGMRQRSLRTGTFRPLLFKHINVRGSTLHAYAQDAMRSGSIYIDSATKALSRLPLDLDPEAPPLLTHRLRQPNQKDITYLLFTWKRQWTIERRLAKERASPEALSAALTAVTHKDGQATPNERAISGFRLSLAAC